MSNEWMKEAIAKIFEKIDQIKSDQSDMKVTLARNTDSLEYHIKRSDKLEEAVDLLRERVDTADDDLLRHDRDNAIRSEALQKSFDQKIQESTNQILALVKPMCENYERERIRKELEEEKKKKFKFWALVIGAVSAVVTVALNAAKLWQILLALL